MGFLEKLQLNTPKKNLHEVPAQSEGEVSLPPKRKKGGARKYPLASSPETPHGAIPGTPERKRGKPHKYPLPLVPLEETQEQKPETAQEESQTEGELTLDVYETDDELVIQSPVAGVKPEELDISLEDDMLTIRGERPLPADEQRKNTILQECYWGPFSRRIVLPAEVDGTNVSASLERGVLTIRIPKLEARKKKKVVVEEIEEQTV